MHFEQSAILTVHNHVITRNPRISVTHDKHDKHKTWFLHIANVQEEDKGRYMCQINTVTAKTQFGYLHVVGKQINNVQSSLLLEFLRVVDFPGICLSWEIANANQLTRKFFFFQMLIETNVIFTLEKNTVPPNIDDAQTSTDVVVREGANVTLRCRAHGSPPPTIRWWVLIAN